MGGKPSIQGMCIAVALFRWKCSQKRGPQMNFRIEFDHSSTCKDYQIIIFEENYFVVTGCN